MIRRPFTLLAVLVVELGGLAAVIWLVLWMGWELPRMRIDGSTYLWMAVGLVPSVIAIPLSMRSQLPMAVELRENALQLWDEAFAGASAVELGVVALLAGFCEEAVFRGVLQPLLVGELGFAGGILLCSLLFGLMHPMSRSYVAAATLIGAWLGVLTVWSGDCVAAIQVHVIHDWLALKALEREASLR